MTADTSFDIGEFPVLSEKQATIARLSLIGFTDPGTFSRATKYAAAGAVTEIGLRHNPTRLTGRVRGSGLAPYVCTVVVEQSDSGKVTALRGACSCPVAEDCKHVFALVITAFREMQMLGSGGGGKQSGPGVRFIQVVPELSASVGQQSHSTAEIRHVSTPAALRTGGAAPKANSGTARSEARPQWLRSISGLLPQSRADDETGEPLGLQVELVRQPVPGGRRRIAPNAQPIRIALRPVLLGAKGKWIRTSISWQNHGMHGYRGKRARADHVELLREISALNYTAGDRYQFDGDVIYLDGLNNSRIWDLLNQAHIAGMAIVQSGPGQQPVVLSDGLGEISAQVKRLGANIVVEPGVSIDGELIDSASFALLGDPLHGIAVWSQTASSPLTLVQSSQRVNPELRQFLAGERIEVPGPDQEVFLRDYLPLLARRLPLKCPDDSIRIPQPHPPTLQLTVTGLLGHQIELSWQWVYRVGETVATMPLWPTAARPTDTEPVRREPVAERVALQSLRLTPGERDRLTQPSNFGPRLTPTVTLGRLDAIAFHRETLPRLRELPRLELILVDEPSFREATAEPVVSISNSQNRTDRDWFDLGITVAVDDENVPFNSLFTALAAGDEFLVLPSGTYFRLGCEPFTTLRRLIEEARALQDVPSRSLKINRFQAALWDELAQLGVVRQQADAWKKSVGGLLQAGDQIVDRPLPAGLNATLRPYQQTGFNWLAFLYDHDLGGVLADDMGLGKTVQTLALICHARAERAGAAPFLVVAPTSVVGNWATECAKFAPGLRVVPVTETTTRSGMELAGLVDGADVVVTSYALFRIQFEDYSAQEWSGLILDEAQFIKNHQSKAYQCAKKLSVPFKLAITGTPMENNLMELWALFSVTSAGLFGGAPAKFKDYYQTPIEKTGNTERLDQLRRRIRPLMLRRTKEQVVKDLPAKQEQVIELELNPKHRKVYQMHLQRERQKVLGMIDDLKKNRFAIFRSLTLLRQLSLDPSLVDPAYGSVPSTKLDALMEQVQDIVAEGHRTLIFSQFTGFLDKVRQRMDVAGVEYCYLDGSTRDRPAVLTEFKTGAAPVFLISLKAGGVGLNLTEADYCILLDPWWNPATEAQAIDRVHRIGQTRNVMVYRLVAKDTIEEKVMALKATKAKLFSSVMDAGSAQSTALTAGDIRELLS